MVEHYESQAVQIFFKGLKLIFFPEDALVGCRSANQNQRAAFAPHFLGSTIALVSLNKLLEHTHSSSPITDLLDENNIPLSWLTIEFMPKQRLNTEDEPQ